MKNYLRVVGVTPKVHLGNVSANVREIRELYNKYKTSTDIVVTPELSLTGYTCADLFNNLTLINNVVNNLISLAHETKEHEAMLVVGLPFLYMDELYNTAAVLYGGKICAIVPKTYLPNYNEFYEKRWFTAKKIDATVVDIGDEKTIFGNNIILEIGPDKDKACIGIEICEDAWVPVSPGRLLALNGAQVILNISASNEVIGKAQYRKELVSAASSSCICAYVYVSAGKYESTSDLVFSGHNLIYENGKCLCESEPFKDEPVIADISLTKLRHDRLANKSFSDCKALSGDRQYVRIKLDKEWAPNEELLTNVSLTPFVPAKDKLKRALSIFNMQVTGLRRRIEATKSHCVVVGVSGGLDSTLALLVSAKAVRDAGLSPHALLGITMPGFGTTSRTKGNSMGLMKALGCTIKDISIVPSVLQHFKDIGQDENVHDVTYENCQARERTQILMDVANKEGGFVVGTGDLSELALGWCTYNGDHMSMYGVNASIPKTLVRTLVDEIGHYLGDNGYPEIVSYIEDIIDTPVSPELLPPNADGTIAQKTEETVGSYILHDFFLYYTLRFGMEPSEIRLLIKRAIDLSDEYKFSDEEVDKWLKVFYTRFFRQQFKRNCMPDGVKVGTVSVSPRGDLRLPSEIEIDEFVNF